MAERDRFNSSGSSPKWIGLSTWTILRIRTALFTPAAITATTTATRPIPFLKFFLRDPRAEIPLRKTGLLQIKLTPNLPAEIAAGIRATSFGRE